VSLETVKTYAYKKIWGEHSLTLGELVAFLIGLALIYFKWLGKWSFWYRDVCGYDVLLGEYPNGILKRANSCLCNSNHGLETMA